MHPRGVRADGVSAYIWQVALPWRGLPSQHRRAARHLGYTSRAWDEELEIHGDRGEVMELQGDPDEELGPDPGAAAAPTQPRVRGHGGRPFSAAEEEELRRGVSLHGTGAWAAILRTGSFAAQRTNVDLKDKWRNMVRSAGEAAGETAAETLPSESVPAESEAVDEAAAETMPGEGAAGSVPAETLPSETLPSESVPAPTEAAGESGVGETPLGETLLGERVPGDPNPNPNPSPNANPNPNPNPNPHPHPNPNHQVDEEDDEAEHDRHHEDHDVRDLKHQEAPLARLARGRGSWLGFAG